MVEVHDDGRPSQVALTERRFDQVIGESAELRRRVFNEIETVTLTLSTVRIQVETDWVLAARRGPQPAWG